MESFGCWCNKIIEEDKSPMGCSSSQEKTLQTPDFDLYVNFWLLNDILKQKVKNTEY